LESGLFLLSLLLFLLVGESVGRVIKDWTPYPFSLGGW
jgi:hypothetical protein